MGCFTENRLMSLESRHRGVGELGMLIKLMQGEKVSVKDLSNAVRYMCIFEFKLN